MMSYDIMISRQTVVNIVVHICSLRSRVVYEERIKPSGWFSSVGATAQSFCRCFDTDSLVAVGAFGMKMICDNFCHDFQSRWRKRCSDH